MEGNIPGIIGGALGVAVILMTVRRKALFHNKIGVLAYGRFLKFLVGFFWMFWVGLVGVLIFDKREDELTGIAVIISFFVGVLAMHLEFFGVQILFDETGIVTHSPWRSSRRIAWSEVRCAFYSSVLQWYVIETEQGRVRLHDFLGGVESLLNELRIRGISVKERI